MSRRNALFAVAAVGASAALLAACGSSASQPPAALPDTHVVVTSAPAVTPSPSPDASASIPADLTINFEPPATSDAKLLSVTAQAKLMVYAFEEALARGDAHDPLLRTVVTDQADLAVTQLLIQLTGKKTRPSGTVTFFKVTPSQTNGFFGVGFCEDDSKAVPVTVQGDARDGSAPSGSNAVRQWEVSFGKDSAGNLQINYLTTQVGGRACT